VTKLTRKTSYLEVAEDLLGHRDPGALEAFHLAEACGADPDRCAAGRWTAHMLAGRFASAWLESDAIRLRGAPDPNRMWNGVPLNNRRIIVRCLHGLGDAIQFLRSAPRLHNLAAEVTYEVPPQLLELAPCFKGVHRAISWGKLAPSVPITWDSQIEVMELPYIFRTELDHLPIVERYLQLPPSHRDTIGRTMGASSVPRVGVVWAAGEWNISRSIPFAIFRQLLSASGCEFWSLQGGTAQSDWDQLPFAPQFHDSACLGAGLMTLACVISQLHLVITVDTLAAHLAGAMGIPAWVLLQHAADWRWMANGATSPWYSSLRLFRQPARGDWAGLIQQVRKELSSWIQTRHHSQKIA
jgi:hypothetical protein